MLLDAARSHLIVVDVQRRLMPAITGGVDMLARIDILLRAAGRLGIPVTVTEQYPKGLGGTVEALSDALPVDTTVLPKMSFSAAADPTIAARVNTLRANGRDQMVVCGAEAHVCVLQTAMAFRQSQLTIAVVSDATGSRAASSVEIARDRLIQAGCQWVNTEMVIFEWLAAAGTDEFRALSPLIR